MSRLYGDLIQSSGKRFYFALDSTPGIVAPGVAQISISGKVPVAVEPQTVFRTPTPALLTLTGISVGAPSALSPGVGAIVFVGQQPNEVRQRTITPALAPAVENPPSPIVPTLITIWTTQPGVAQVNLQTLPLNVTQGGNIGFVSPGVGLVSLQASPITLLLLAGNVGVAGLQVLGLAPSLQREVTVFPDVGLLTLPPMQPEIALPFTWIDDDPAPARAWITDAAA